MKEFVNTNFRFYNVKFIGEPKNREDFRWKNKDNIVEPEMNYYVANPSNSETNPLSVSYPSSISIMEPQKSIHQTEICMS